MSQIEEKSAGLIVRADIKEYGLYTLQHRVLPDARDGLKPVQRLILWSLWVLKKTSKTFPVKCAKVASHTTGDYHPHGEEACYQSLVNLRWQRYPLVVDEGNFGNPSRLIPTPAAAARYPETKLQELSERFFDDIHVAEMESNYNEELQQPVVLPARVPMLLVNGSEGIATGISTCFPPHNLTEVLDAAELVLTTPDATIDQLLKKIKGPDYGSGVLLSKKRDMVDLYETGKGKLQFSCTYEIEDGSKTGPKKLVITGKAPGFRGEKFLKETVALKDKGLISVEANDEGSLKRGTRITVEYRDPQVVKDRLLPLLHTTEHYQMYALDSSGSPRLYTLQSLLHDWIEHRRDIEEKVLRHKFAELKKKFGKDKARLLTILNIEEVVDIIKTSSSVKSALAELQDFLEIEQWQAEVILDTPLRSLMTLNRAELQTRLKALRKAVKAVKHQLKNIDDVVLARIRETREKYGDARGTRLRKALDDLEDQEAATYYIGVTSNGKVESFSVPPLKSKAVWPYVALHKSSGPLLVVKDDNTAHYGSLSYLDKMDLGGAVTVGFATDQHQHVVVVTNTGRYVCFETVQKRKRFNVFRGLEADESIAAAYGINPKDRLIVGLEGGRVVKPKLLKVTRPNVKPKLLAPNIEEEVTFSLVKRPRDMLVDTETGEEVGLGSIGTTPLWVVGKNNLVLLDNGRRVVKKQNKLLDALDSGNSVQGIVPV